MTAAIRPLTTMPSKKTAGSRKRSDLSIAAYTVALAGDRIACGPDLIADAPHGHDRGGLPELPSQLAYMNVHGPRITGERVAPDSLEQLVAREHEAAMVEQLPEQVELLRRELHLLVANLHFTPAGVDHELAVLDRGALRLTTLGGGSAQDGLHARDELARVERLRHVVVGADFEADDLVHVLVPGRQHQDRDVGLLTDATADLDPVDVREHQVEHDQRGLLLLHGGERLRAVRGAADFVAGVLAVERDEGCDRGLVLHDEH